MEDSQISTVGECYACTRVSIPVFHSASWNETDQPEWEASAGSSLLPIKNRLDRKTINTHLGSSHPFVRILDSRSKGVRRWNWAILLARSMSLAVDPLFFYVLSVGRGGSPCLYIDGGLVAIATVLRVCLDVLHLCHVWLQFRLAFVPKESLVIGCGKLVWDTRAIAAHYLRSLNGFWFDFFVILPVPQVIVVFAHFSLPPSADPSKLVITWTNLMIYYNNLALEKERVTIYSDLIVPAGPWIMSASRGFYLATML